MRSAASAMLFCLALAACSGGIAGDDGAAAAEDFNADTRPRAQTLVYDCDGYAFVARLGAGEMAVWLQDEYLVLSQVRAASGTRYEEGTTAFWSRGDDATLYLGEQHYSNCRLQPRRAPWEDARRRGVDFRAAGNEPGWYLEIQAGRQILMVAEEGRTRLVFPEPEPAIPFGDERLWQVGNASNALEVKALQTECIDSMSGDSFPLTVEANLNGRFFRGCGEDLENPWE